MKGRVCVITGASSGIGLETAKALAVRGARVRLVGRNPERTRDAEVAVRQSAKESDVQSFQADFSSLDAVENLAGELLRPGEPIHVLVNNAGVWHQERRSSKEGFEDTFAVNHLAPFLLTHRLLGRMLESDGDRRIVHVSSRLHEQAGLSGPMGRAVYLANVVGIPIRLTSPGLNLGDLAATGSYRGLEAYARSKLAQILFSAELARRLDATIITSNAVHPGSVATNVIRDSKALALATRLAQPFLKTASQGAATSVYAASDPSLRGVSGKYLADCQIRVPAPSARDSSSALELWNISMEMVGLRTSDLAEVVRAPSLAGAL